MRELLQAIVAALTFDSSADDEQAIRLACARSNMVIGMLQAHLEHEPYLPDDLVTSTTLGALRQLATGMHDEEALALFKDRLEGP